MFSFVLYSHMVDNFEYSTIKCCKPIYLLGLFDVEFLVTRTLTLSLNIYLGLFLGHCFS